MSKKVVFKNIHYSSLSDFYYKNEKEIEVSYSVLLNNFKTGMPIENAIKKQPRKRKESKHGPFLVEGKEYINIPSLAAEYQLNSNTIFKRFERGKRGNDLIPKNKRKTINHLFQVSKNINTILREKDLTVNLRCVNTSV